MAKIKYFFLAPLVVLMSCATLYQSEGLFTNGYSDLRAGQDTFVVTFRANEHTSAEKVEKYALRRAAEVARQNGYRYFVIIDRMGESKKQHLYYPSLRLTIQCFKERPEGIQVLKA